MKKLPIGIQAFETMRTQGYVYVDKTRYVHKLVTEGMFYFLARPRRFGKSLLVSTLKCLFQGKRTLFEGLWIAEHGAWEWPAHPVVIIDFSEIPVSTPEKLEKSLSSLLHKTAARYDVSLTPSYIELEFRDLIVALAEKTGMPVPVLVDEYDKPIIDHIGRGQAGLQTARANRDVLRSFFGVLKGATVANKLRFVFLTGVSRFSKVSIFSELNNLFDISMSRDYAAMLGYTDGELALYFREHILQMARSSASSALAQSVPGVKEQLAEYYNGYRFSESPTKVYNPFSILNALREKALRSFWFESGTPTFLIDVLRQKQYDPPQIERLQVSRSVFTTFEIDQVQPEALLFQTGYLTIKDVEGRLYTLGYPNREVKTAFTEALLYAWMAGPGPKTSSRVLQLSEYLQAENLDAFFETIKAIFASIPYDIEAKRDEAYFHTLFYLMIAASGGDAHSSVLTCRGRIDLVVAFPDKVYIIEFKCDQSADAAVQQIKDKAYADAYRATGRRVMLVGINFSREARNLAAWKVEPLA